MSKCKSTDLRFKSSSGSLMAVPDRKFFFKPSNEGIWEKLLWFCPHIRITLEKIRALAWENNSEAWENWNIVQGLGRFVFCIFLFAYFSLYKLGLGVLSYCQWSCFNQVSIHCLGFDGAIVPCNWGLTNRKNSLSEACQCWTWDHCSVLWLYFK